MPVRIRIDVNGRDQRTYWIGRIKGKAEPDWINTYIIAEGDEYVPDWQFDSLDAFPSFTHRYGDGLEVCAQRGLEAWNGNVR